MTHDDRRDGCVCPCQVVKAFDRVSGTWVAIKLIKRLKVFTAQAQTEIRILRHLKRRDPLRRWHIVTMMDSFVHDGHQCIVFEMLSSNLYEVLRGTRFRGLSLTLVRHVGRQLAEALHFLDNESVRSGLPPSAIGCAIDSGRCSDYQLRSET